MWSEQYQQSISKKYWNIFLVFIFVYFIMIQVYVISFFAPTDIRFAIITIIFYPPFLIDFAVIILSCYYLINLECRFQTLNNVWQCLPTGLVAISGSYTYSEITVMLENIRLLHADLCELLRIFSLGFGQILLGYFVISYINMVYQYFLMVSYKFVTSTFNPITNVMRNLLPYIMNVQQIMFIMFIIVISTRIIEKVRAALYKIHIILLR